MSAKRAYTLGKRAASIEETRLRILDAAAEAYRDHGVHATSMQEVARRADVAPGTVLHHFPDPEQLVESVVAHLIASLDLPSARIFDGVEQAEARLYILIRDLYEFYERGDDWQTMFFRDRASVPAFRKGQAAVMASIGALLRAAMGRLADDAQVGAVVGAAIDPAFRGALLRSGLSPAQAIETGAALVTAWLDRHLTHADRRRRPVGRARR